MGGKGAYEPREGAGKGMGWVWHNVLIALAHLWWWVVPDTHTWGIGQLGWRRRRRKKKEKILEARWVGGRRTRGNRKGWQVRVAARRKTEEEAGPWERLKKIRGGMPGGAAATKRKRREAALLEGLQKLLGSLSRRGGGRGGG